MLAKHADGIKNFDVKLYTVYVEGSKITKNQLKQDVKQLFSDDSDIALCYFAGQGYMDMIGVYIWNSECQIGDDGLFLD